MPKVADLVAEAVAADEAAEAAERAAINGHKSADDAVFELGKSPSRPPALVNTTDANGEAIAVDVPIEPAPETAQEAPDLVLEIQLPTFHGRKYPDAIVNFSGRIELELKLPEHKSLWDQIEMHVERKIDLDLICVVGDVKFHPKISAEGEVTGRYVTASLKVLEITDIQTH